MILIGCTEKYSTLIITIKNNDNNVFNFPELNKLVIKKDNKIFKTILPSNKNPFIDNPIKIDSLERGIYQFEYIDLFGRNQIKTYEAKNRKNIDTLSINPDYIDISKLLFVSSPHSTNISDILRHLRIPPRSHSYHALIQNIIRPPLASPRLKPSSLTCKGLATSDQTVIY